MPTSPRVALLAVFAVVGVLFPASAHAGTQRKVFLGLNGNDLNDCSKPATPCASFVGAMAQVNAGGEILVQDTGAYGPLNITQSLSINSAAGVVAFTCCQVSVNVAGGKVVLRGLTIDGDGAAQNGINVVAVGLLYVEKCIITGFSGSSQTAGNGLFFGTSSTPSALFVTDTIVRNNGNVGIWVAPGSLAFALVDHCRIEGNMGDGLDAASHALVTISNSIVSWNNRGLFARGGINVENCVSTANTTGIAADSTGVVTVSSSNVTLNGTGILATGGGSVLSRSNNTLYNNTTDGSFTGTISAQ
jgi:hypothetical protein